jgi:Holliday junction resolvase
MRRAAKIDGNHEEVVSALRKAGAVVQSLAAIGKGCPDILCAFRGNLFLLEVKDGSKPPSKQRLTTDQQQWHQAWGALVEIVNSPEQALRAIGAVNDLSF